MNTYNLSVGLLNLYQGQASLSANRLNRSLFPLPTNNSTRSRWYGTGTAQYITNIRSAASSITDALGELSGRDYSEQEPSYEPMQYFGSDQQAFTHYDMLDATAVQETESPEHGDSAGIDSVERLVSSYNSLRSEVLSRSSNSSDGSLEARLMSISDSFAGALSSLGLGVDSAGVMKIDRQELDQALEDGRLEQFFAQGAYSGLSFGTRLGKLANDVIRNPSSYVESREFNFDHSKNFGYSSFGMPVKVNLMIPGTLMDFML